MTVNKQHALKSHKKQVKENDGKTSEKMNYNNDNDPS